LNVEVVPLDSNQKGLTLVLFEPVPRAAGLEAERPGAPPEGDVRDRQISQLKQQLAGAKERFCSAIEAHQTSREESQNTTEEALSANEELQSLNEELETAKEELQSTNDELIRVKEPRSCRSHLHRPDSPRRCARPWIPMRNPQGGVDRGSANLASDVQHLHPGSGNFR
jgi:two-component system, chemotaxis family, CheB/CheR fusion protein